MEDKYGRKAPKYQCREHNEIGPVRQFRENEIAQGYFQLLLHFNWPTNFAVYFKLMHYLILAWLVFMSHSPGGLLRMRASLPSSIGGFLFSSASSFLKHHNLEHSMRR